MLLVVQQLVVVQCFPRRRWAHVLLPFFSSVTSFIPDFHRVMWWGPGSSSICSRLHYRSETLSLGNLTVHNRLQASLPNLYPRERHYLYYAGLKKKKKNLSSTPEGDFSISANNVHYIKNLWKDSLEQRLSASLLMRCAEMWETCEELFWNSHC